MPPEQTRRVLWADDEIDLLRPHIKFLEQKGFAVTAVPNGEDALTALEGNRFDVVLLDEMMPGITGLETLQAIQSRALGVPEPSLPTKDGAFAALRAKTIPDAITAKKGAKLSAVFSLGVAVTDAWFGAMLGSDPKPAIADIETYAKAAGTPESAYKSQLDAMKAKATEEGLKNLAQGLETHYKGK